jgi:hypothetical protein
MFMSSGSSLGLVKRAKDPFTNNSLNILSLYLSLIIQEFYFTKLACVESNSLSLIILSHPQYSGCSNCFYLILIFSYLL